MAEDDRSPRETEADGCKRVADSERGALHVALPVRGTVWVRGLRATLGHVWVLWRHCMISSRHHGKAKLTKLCLSDFYGEVTSTRD